MRLLHTINLRDTNIIAIDALMGTGKSKLAKSLRAELTQLRIPSIIISIDDDCPSREERAEKSGIDWHGSCLIPAALDIFLADFRTGNAGRGLAVVADAVKKLAGNSDNSVEDIEQTAISVESDIENAEASINAVLETLQSLRGIFADVRQVSAKIHAVSQVIQQVSGSISADSHQVGDIITAATEQANSIALIAATELSRVGTVSGLMYNTATGRKDRHKTITVPNPEQSVMIVEGITVLEKIMRVVSATRNGTNRVCPVYLYCEEEERNRRRRERDAKKGLTGEEIERRIRTQQNDLRCYEKDTRSDRFLKDRMRVIDCSANAK